MLHRAYVPAQIRARFARSWRVTGYPAIRQSLFGYLPRTGFGVGDTLHATVLRVTELR
jgi:hypothetical protein